MVTLRWGPASAEKPGTLRIESQAVKARAMTEEPTHPIVEIIGAECFAWLSGDFSRKTPLFDVPEEILKRVSRVDALQRDFSSDPDAITAIALVTFAYALAEKQQEARCGTHDLLLLKVLARGEMARRGGERRLQNPFWSAPLYQLITGEVGERIRGSRTMTPPASGPE